MPVVMIRLLGDIGANAGDMVFLELDLVRLHRRNIADSTGLPPLIVPYPRRPKGEKAVN